MKTQVKPVNAGSDELATLFPSVSKNAGNSARLVLGYSREHLVEEVVNDVLLQLWKAHQDGKLPRNLNAWVREVAKNRALRFARGPERRYTKSLVEELPDQGAGFNANCVLMPQDTLTPGTTSEFTERLAAVKKLLATFHSVVVADLDAGEKLLFELRYRRCLSDEAIAFELGLSQPAVRKQWSRLLTRVLETVRAQLKQDPLCADLLGTFLANEKEFRRGFLGVLHVVTKHGVEELERIVRAVFDR